MLIYEEYSVYSVQYIYDLRTTCCTSICTVSLVIALKIKLRTVVILLLLVVENCELHCSCYIQLRDVHAWFSINRSTGSKVGMATHIIFLCMHPHKRYFVISSRSCDFRRESNQNMDFDRRNCKVDDRNNRDVVKDWDVRNNDIRQLLSSVDMVRAPGTLWVCGQTAVSREDVRSLLYSELNGRWQLCGAWWGVRRRTSQCSTAVQGQSLLLCTKYHYDVDIQEADRPWCVDPLGQTYCLLGCDTSPFGIQVDTRSVPKVMRMIFFF
jgi:hypothetical protein